MFSISSVGVGSKGIGSEVSTSRVKLRQEQHEHNQPMSNVNNFSSNMNPNVTNLNSQQTNQTHQ